MPDPLLMILRSLRSRRAVAAMEFALALPVLIGVLFGIIDCASYVGTANRLQRLAAELANVGAQFERLRNSLTVTAGDEVGVLFVAAREIARPLAFPDATGAAVAVQGAAGAPVDQARGGVIVTSVTAQSGGPRIAWQAYAGTSPANSRLGSGTGAVTLPAGFTLRLGDNALFVEVFYTLRPFLLGGGWLGTGSPTVTAYASAVFRPRMGALTTLDP